MKNDFNTKLGLRIRELRVTKRITQGKLADLLEMERSNLTRIECGKQAPNYENLMKISLALNVEIKEIFDFEHTIKTEKQLKAEIVKQLDSLSTKELNFINKSIKELKFLK